MATHTLFQNYATSGESNILNNLIVESIKIYGMDVYYIPRRLGNKDALYGADDQSYYNLVYPIEMYLKSFDAFQGDGNILSKFMPGMEIRDQVIFQVARSRFEDEITTKETDIPRPREGDLIYFPYNKKCFTIRFVEKFEMLYQLGSLYLYTMTCELFEYSSEVFETGIPEIDRLQQIASNDLLDWSLTDENGNWLTTENDDYLVVDSYNIETINPLSNNDDIEDEANEIMDWSEQDPFSDYGNKKV